MFRVILKNTNRKTHPDERLAFKLLLTGKYHVFGKLLNETRRFVLTRKNKYIYMYILLQKQIQAIVNLVAHIPYVCVVCGNNQKIYKVMVNREHQRLRVAGSGRNMIRYG